MSEYPYTDKQARSFWDSMTARMEPGEAEEGHVWLRRLHEAGITVTFPKPRYRVSRNTRSFNVMDDSPDVLGSVATFRGPNAEHYAHLHADRLNRENADG